MAKKQAGQLKQGDRIKLPGTTAKITKIETSNIGKHGTVKCRIVAETESGEEKILIRPSNYPIEVI